VKKTFLITGATGLIGKYLVKSILTNGDTVIALSTNVEKAKLSLPGVNTIVNFNDHLSLKNESIDAIINLAGANLGSKHWTEKAKKEFYDSRINVTGKVVDLISKMDKKPEVLVSASGIDIYGDRGEEDIYEEDKLANTFLANLCRDWEAEALKAEEYGVRVVLMRTALVLAKESSALKKLVLPFRFFTGGYIGSGKQYVSWIHIDDLVAMYLYASENHSIKGAINTSSPEPLSMKEFSHVIGKVLIRSSWLNVPSFLIKIILGEMSEVVLTGRKALPKKILDAGFKFKYTNLSNALTDLLLL
jgi:uncharacterized protein